jgi:hypothetical protein
MRVGCLYLLCNSVLKSSANASATDRLACGKKSQSDLAHIDLQPLSRM